MSEQELAERVERLEYAVLLLAHHIGGTGQELAERVERLEYAVLLLAHHIGGTGWDRPLQEVLDAIADDDREVVKRVVKRATEGGE